MHRMSTLLQQLEQLAPLAADITPRESTVAEANLRLRHSGTADLAAALRFNDAARNLLTPENLALLIAQQAAPVAGWIAVGDGLPYYGEVALVATAHPLGGFSVMQRTFRYMGEEGWQRHTTVGGNSGRAITHWMPLPQPPTAPADAPR